MSDPAVTRHDWTLEEIRSIHDLPLLELLHRTQGVHREHHPKNEVRLCTHRSVLAMVKRVKTVGIEVCTTLGMLLLTTPNPDASFDRRLLADAGLTPLGSRAP